MGNDHITADKRLRYASPKFPFGKLLLSANIIRHAC